MPNALTHLSRPEEQTRPDLQPPFIPRRCTRYRGAEGGPLYAIYRPRPFASRARILKNVSKEVTDLKCTGQDSGVFGAFKDPNIFRNIYI